MSTITRTLKKIIKPIHLSRLKLYTSTFRFEGSEAVLNSQGVNKPKGFTNQEELIIVETINRCSEADFEKYDIKKPQLKKLMAYKERNGEFKTFSDVLVTQDVPSLIKLCKSILVGGKGKSKVTAKLSGPAKSTTVPAVDIYTKENVKSVLGLHIWSNTISWALLQENNLIKWEQKNYENPSKSSLVPLINLISTIADEIPHADAYVMEADPYASIGKLKGAAYIFYVQRQQVIATIISILGMRRRLSNYNRSKDPEDQKINNFFMMAPRSSAKRFKLTVGNEIMPGESIVKDILEKNLHEKIPDLPKITVNEDLIDGYYSSHGLDRDQLHSALLTAVAFADIIHQNDGVAKERKTEPSNC